MNIDCCVLINGKQQVEVMVEVDGLDQKLHAQGINKKEDY